jgi:hypothetical protein
MGAAKRRGTYEERKAEGMAKTAVIQAAEQKRQDEAREARAEALRQRMEAEEKRGTSAGYRGGHRGYRSGLSAASVLAIAMLSQSGVTARRGRQ